MGAKQTSHLHVENVSPEEVTVDVMWGAERSRRHIPSMSNSSIEGRPQGTARVEVIARFGASGGDLRFFIDERDLRNHATHVQVGLARGVGIARVNGAERASQWIAKEALSVVERNQRARAPSPLIPRQPPMVQLNPRITRTAVPSVTPRHPPVLDSSKVDSTYRFDFGPEIEVLREEGFAVGMLNERDGGDNPQTPRSPVPSPRWSRPS